MNVGLIGCGFISDKHIAAMLSLPEQFQIVALADIERERLSAAMDKVMRAPSTAQPPTAYDDYLELLGDNRVELAVITVPSGIHGQVAGAALRHGKHVLVEKPFTLSIREGEELVQLADHHGLKLVVCHQKRFYPHLQRLRQVVHEHGLGRLATAQLTVCMNRSTEYYRSAPWRGTWHMDGGLMLNQAIHDLDLFLWILGEPTWTMGHATQLVHSDIETEDTAAAILGLPDGCTGTFVATVCAPPRSHLERFVLVGTDGIIELAGKQLDRVEKWECTSSAPPTVSQSAPYRDLYLDTFAAVVDDLTPMTDGHQALTALRTIAGIYLSWRTGGLVRFPCEPLDMSALKGVIRFAGT